jgi:hypothetical protein
VRATGDFRGHSVEMSIIPKGNRVWLMALLTGGSARARHDFESVILQSIRLPA